MQIGATPATPADAVADADLVVVTIPMRAIPELDGAIFERLPARVPVVDTGNVATAARSTARTP